MASGADLQDLPEVRDLIRHLCEKAPEAARAFAIIILEYSPNDDAQQESAANDSNNGDAVKRKRSSNRDPSYRPPRGIQKQTSNGGESLGDGGISTKDIADRVKANSGVGPLENEASLSSNQQQHSAQDKLVPEREDAPTAGDEVKMAVD